MRYDIRTSLSGPVLALRDQLTFGDRNAFDEVVEELAKPGTTAVTVDLEQLSYMDSAGLGMLLTLRDRAERAGAVVKLVSPRGEVKDLLELACFDTLFTIEV